jgi:thiosulfate reductase cytochrome b subunit
VPQSFSAFRDAWHVMLYDLRLRKELPAQKKYNAAQQITYTAIVAMGAGSVLSGLAIYKPVQLGWLAALLGGYEFARLIHFALTIGYLIFFVIHIAQVIRAGWRNFQSMVTGYELEPRTGAPHE